jgi:hypothetical protein
MYWINECGQQARDGPAAWGFDKGLTTPHRKYEVRLKSSWTRLIIPSRNFVEVQWRSLFWSTSLGKRCNSYNAPPTSRKCAADRLPQASEEEWSRWFWPWSSLFMVEKAQIFHGARFGLYGGCSNGVPPISVSTSIATFQSRNADAPLRMLRHPRNGSFKTTVTQTLTTVREMKITPLLRYPTTTTWHNSHRLSLHNRSALTPVHEVFKRPSYVACLGMLHRTSDLDYLERPWKRKMDMRFGEWVYGWLDSSGSGWDKWRVIVKTIMILQIPPPPPKRKRGICWLVEWLLAPEEGLCCLELVALSS